MHPILTQLAAETASDEVGPVATLGLDPKSFILQLIAFGLVFFILKKFAFGPIVKTLEERRSKIYESLKTAEQNDKRRAKSAAEQAKLLATARDQADKILAEAKVQAGEMATTAQENAAAKAKEMISDARSAIERSVEKARTELKRDTIELVAMATEKIIDEKIDDERDRKFIESRLENVR